MTLGVVDCAVHDGVLEGNGEWVDVAEYDGEFEGDAVAVLLWLMERVVVAVCVGDPVWLELPVPVFESVPVELADPVPVELADPVPV
jgi:hypothetical protein